MKVIHIPPFAHLGLYEQDMHMVIAPFLSDNEPYKEFYMNLPKSHYIILDNGTFEKGESCSDEMLIELAKELNVDEIVVPDVMMDADETIMRMADFFGVLSKKDESRFKYQAVLQGDSISDLGIVYDWISSVTHINVVAFPKWIDIKWNGIRAQLTKVWDPILYDLHEVHLLGLTSPQTLIDCDPRVRSCDSSLAFRAAANLHYFSSKTINNDRMDWSLILSEYDQYNAGQHVEYLQRCTDGNK